MRKIQKWMLGCLLAGAFAFAACQSGEDPEEPVKRPAATKQVEPTVAPTDTPAPTAEPTATPELTATPIPTPTKAPIPEPTPIVVQDTVENALEAYAYTISQFATELEDSSEVKYYLLPLEDKEIPYLVLADGYYRFSKVHFFYYKDGAVVDAGAYGEYASCGFVEKEGILIDGFTSEEGVNYVIYQVVDGTATVVEKYLCNYETEEYLKNGEEIDSADFSEALGAWLKKESLITYESAVKYTPEDTSKRRNILDNIYGDISGKEGTPQLFAEFTMVYGDYYLVSASGTISGEDFEYKGDGTDRCEISASLSIDYLGSATYWLSAHNLGLTTADELFFTENGRPFLMHNSEKIEGMVSNAWSMEILGEVEDTRYFIVFDHTYGLEVENDTATLFQLIYQDGDRMDYLELTFKRQLEGDYDMDDN